MIIAMRIAPALLWGVLTVAVGTVLLLRRPHAIEPIEEAKGPLDSISGSYVRGHGKGDFRTLRIRADNRFRFTVQGCLGTYVDCGGAARLEGTRLELSPDD